MYQYIKESIDIYIIILCVFTLPPSLATSKDIKNNIFLALFQYMIGMQWISLIYILKAGEQVDTLLMKTI